MSKPLCSGIQNHTKPYHTIPNHTKPNQTKGISALGLDRDLGFSRGHQGCPGHRPHDDDDDEEEDDEVEDNDKDDVNNKEDNNDKGISALELDRDLGF